MTDINQILETTEKNRLIGSMRKEAKRHALLTRSASESLWKGGNSGRAKVSKMNGKPELESVRTLDSLSHQLSAGDPNPHPSGRWEVYYLARLIIKSALPSLKDLYDTYSKS